MTADARATESAGGLARSRAYERALRHSKRVRFYKRVIPAGAAVAVLLLAGLTFFNPFRAVGGSLSIGSLSLSGTKVVMEQPRLTGFQKDTRPYEVTATEALQDVKRPTLVELKALRARVVMDDAGTVARLEAEEGLFDTQKELLDLKRDVRVTTTSGYSADLKSASVDFKAGTVSSREPVRVGISGGTVEADSLDITDNGRVVVFQGRVRSVFQSPGEAGRKRAATTEAATGGSPAADPPSPPPPRLQASDASPTPALRTTDAAPETRP